LNNGRYYPRPVGWAVLIVAGASMWTGSILLIDAFGRRRKRRTLLERLAPYQPRSIGDQAESWLRDE
jgi:hypothetical protein